MNCISPTVAAAIVAAALASPCTAGQVKLEIRNGLVSLDARDATPREILAEWARIGQTRMVNAERVPGGPLTLQLTNVPEARALDILLQSVAGYVAAPRAVVVAAAASRFDRVVIMAVPRPPAGGASPAAPAPAAPAPTFDRGRMGMPPQPGYQPPQSLMLDDQDERVDPRTGQPEPRGPQMFMPGQTPGATMPGMVPPGMAGQQPPYPYFPNPQQAPTTPGMMTSPSPAANRPGVLTSPAKPPGNPGGNPGGN